MEADFKNSIGTVNYHVSCHLKAQRIGYKSRDMASAMLEKAGIATAPGPVFGLQGEGYLRFCYVNSIENIETMLEKLSKFISAGK